eukprot:scaffold21187_cov54-Attheya_sp.AAC.2
MSGFVRAEFREILRRAEGGHGIRTVSTPNTVVNSRRELWTFSTQITQQSIHVGNYGHIRLL